MFVCLFLKFSIFLAQVDHCCCCSADVLRVCIFVLETFVAIFMNVKDALSGFTAPCYAWRPMLPINKPRKHKIIVFLSLSSSSTD